MAALVMSSVEYSRRPDREFFDQVVDFVLDAIKGSLAAKEVLSG
jgi:hypothetical protein